jgi:two-component system phosphate regulon sensor histidine kinase PhoR
LQDESAAEHQPTRARFMKIMWDEARRMHRLVDDLISLSRIEAERFSPPRESVELLPLIEDVRAAAGNLIDEKAASSGSSSMALDPVVLG